MVLILLKCATVLCMDFHVSFLNTAPNIGGIELIVTTTDQRPVNVDISTPPGAYPAFQKAISVSPKGAETVLLPTALRPNGIGMSYKGVLVHSDGNISVTTINKGSCSASLNLPSENLGNRYYIVTWWRDGDQITNTQSLVNIVATKATTKVKVKFTTGRGVSVSYGGVMYGSGHTLSVTLQQYQLFTIEDMSDLTGLYVTSDFPVAVYAGNIDINIGTTAVRDNTASQMTPVPTWGKEFYVVPLPGNTVGGYIKMVGAEDNTNVTIYRSTTSTTYTTTISKAGDPLLYDLGVGAFTTIVTDKPVMPIYYSRGQTGTNSEAFPSALLLPPKNQFLNRYYFTTVSDNTKTFKAYLLLVIREDHIGGLTLDGFQLTASNWTDMPSTDPLIVSRAALVSPGTHEIYHSDPTVYFGAYIHGYAVGDCAYAFPAGMGLVDLTQVS